MLTKDVKKNSLRAWILAARPKTLVGAVVPVIVSGALFYALCHFCCCAQLQVLSPSFIPFCLALLFALLMQKDANFINDYLDFKRGTDTSERLGPKRACAQGWITPRAMRTGIIITTILACAAGFPLVFYGGYWLILVGVACVVLAFLYTSCLAQRGLGDLLVLLCFGLIPLFFTVFCMMTSLALKPFTLNSLIGGVPIFVIVIISGIAVGLVTDNLLIINNYRDREQDAQAGKRTLVVRIGEKKTEYLYLLNGIVGTLIAVFVALVIAQGNTLRIVLSFVPLLYLYLNHSAFLQMRKIKKGAALNHVLGITARNILLFGLLFTLSLIVG